MKSKNVLPQEIVYLITSIEKIANTNYNYFFTDGQANASITLIYDSLDDLDKPDWDIINDKFWQNTEDDNDRKRRKQAEFLVYKDINLEDIIGIAVYNEKTKRNVIHFLEKSTIENFVVKIRKFFLLIMIIYKKGNIINDESEALVNTVNTVGVMGKGVALAFKKAFPENFKIYQESCKNNKLKIVNYSLPKQTRYILNISSTSLPRSIGATLQNMNILKPGRKN